MDLDSGENIGVLSLMFLFKVNIKTVVERYVEKDTARRLVEKNCCRKLG